MLLCPRRTRKARELDLRRAPNGKLDEFFMCGIIGIIGNGSVAPMILDGLRRLEYRGYDSAGIATIDASDDKLSIQRCRAAGKINHLAEKLNVEPLAGMVGIGHTRWATHGAPTEQNAHPHASDDVVVVHNGIIENFETLRAELVATGLDLCLGH